MNIEVEVEELCTRTVTSIPMITPVIGFDKKSLFAKMSPAVFPAVVNSNIQIRVQFTSLCMLHQLTSLSKDVLSIGVAKCSKDFKFSEDYLWGYSIGLGFEVTYGNLVMTCYV